MNATKISMKLQQTVKRVAEGFSSRRVLGSGWVLFGNVGGEDTHKWFERRFESADAAKKYAAKRGWVVEEQAVAV